MPVRRGRNAESAALGNRFAEETHQRGMNARVLDADGRQEKFHAASGVIAASENVRPSRDSYEVETNRPPGSFSRVPREAVCEHRFGDVARVCSRTLHPRDRKRQPAQRRDGRPRARAAEPRGCTRPDCLAERSGDAALRTSRRPLARTARARGEATDARRVAARARRSQRASWIGARAWTSGALGAGAPASARTGRCFATLVSCVKPPPSHRARSHHRRARSGRSGERTRFLPGTLASTRHDARHTTMEVER